MDVLPRLKFLGAIAAFTHTYVFPYFTAKIIYEGKSESKVPYFIATK